jgi:hypothetical protein
LVGYSPVLPQCLPVVVCCGLQRTPRRHARPGRRPLARVRAWQLNFMRDRPRPARCHARRLIRLRQRRLKERRPGASRVPLLMPAVCFNSAGPTYYSSLARPPAPPIRACMEMETTTTCMRARVRVPSAPLHWFAEMERKRDTYSRVSCIFLHCIRVIQDCLHRSPPRHTVQYIATYTIWWRTYYTCRVPSWLAISYS